MNIQQHVPQHPHIPAPGEGTLVDTPNISLSNEQLRAIISEKGLDFEVLYHPDVHLEHAWKKDDFTSRLLEVAIWNKTTDRVHIRHPLESDRVLTHDQFRALCTDDGLAHDELIKTNSEAHSASARCKSRLERFCRFDEQTKTYHFLEQDWSILEKDYSIISDIRNPIITNEVKEEDMVDSGAEEDTLHWRESTNRRRQRVYESDEMETEEELQTKMLDFIDWVILRRKKWATVPSCNISSILSSYKLGEHILNRAIVNEQDLKNPNHRFMADIIHNICRRKNLKNLLCGIEALVVDESQCVLINDGQTYAPGATIPSMPQLQQMYQEYQKDADPKRLDYWTLVQKRSWGATLVHAWCQIRATYTKHKINLDARNMDIIPSENARMKEYMGALRSVRSSPHDYAIYTTYFKPFDPYTAPNGERRWEYEFSTRKRLLACELKGVTGDDRFKQAGANAFVEFETLLRRSKPYFELAQAFGGHGIFLVLPTVSATGMHHLKKWCYHDFAAQVLARCPDVRTYVQLLTKNVLVPAFAGEREQLCRLPLLASSVDLRKTPLIDLVTVRDS